MQAQVTNNARKILEESLKLAMSRCHSLVIPEHALFLLTDALPLSIDETTKIKFELNSRFAKQALTQASPTQSPLYQQLLNKAYENMLLLGDTFLSVVHILLALCSMDVASSTFSANKDKITTFVRSQRKTAINSEEDPFSLDGLTLEKEKELSFVVEMVQQAREGRFDPFTGRDNEVRYCIEVLSKKIKSNVLLVGSPGVGKTSVVAAIAQKIANNELPTLKDYKIYNLDLSSVVAGSKYRGEFEKRLKDLLKSLDSKSILFIDEIHMAINNSEAMDTANILKPALINDLKCIGATTFYEYRKFIEKDFAFARRFVKITLNEPTKEQSLAMLRGLKQRFEAFHGLRILDEALVASVEMAKKYMIGRFLPDSAVDLLDGACASAVISVEAEEPEALAIKSKLWGLGLEKASLELDLKRRGHYSPDDVDSSSGPSQQPNDITHYSKQDTEAIRTRIEEVDKEIAHQKTLLEPIEEAHRNRKILLDKRKNIQQKIDDYQLKYDQAVRENDRTRAADLVNFIIPSLKEELQKLKKNVTLEISKTHIQQVVANLTNIPVHKLALSETQRLLNLEETLNSQVYGQEEACSLISNCLIAARQNLNDPNKPLGTFLFLGPTGVGKTELAKVIASHMFDNNHIFLDMSDYASEISLTKLIGSSAGYVGYDEGGKLTEFIRNHPYSLVLFDEVDLAHHTVMNVLYQLLDEGRIVDGKGVEIDFRNCIIILTSNLGYKNLKLTDYLHQNPLMLGTSPKPALNAPGASPESKHTEEESKEKPIQHIEYNPQFLKMLKQNANNETVSRFGPALYNRIDAVIHFNPLNTYLIERIFFKELENINQRLKQSNLQLHVTHSAKIKILRNGTNIEHGARPLKKYLQQSIVNHLGKIVLRKNVDDNKNSMTILNVNSDKIGERAGDFFIDVVNV